jgi:hypothetical protein
MSSPAIIAIKRAVAAEFGIDVRAIEGPNRSRRFAWPRQVAMYLARDLTQRSTTEIGRAFGGRDHTTVIYAEREVSGRLERDSNLVAALARLRNRLLGTQGAILSMETTIEAEMLGRLEAALSEAGDAIDVIQRELQRAVKRLEAAVSRERDMVEALRRGDA